MKDKTLLEKIDLFLNEGDVDWVQVQSALVDAAEDIFGEADEEKIEGIIENLKKHKPADTENAIQIGIDMMRDEG
mgnify:CR=1 FL=1